VRGWPLGWREGLDVALMTFLVYQAYIRLRGTRAARIGGGLAVMGVLYFLAQAMGLLLTSWVLSGVWTAALILLIIVFQTEIRQVLEQLPPLVPSFAFLRGLRPSSTHAEMLSSLADICFVLTRKRCGALLLFERKDQLEPLLRSPGLLLDARVSAQLVENIFTPAASLHDGAILLRNDRLARAGCILPLSETGTLPHFYGTRHRAAVGITERSDALAVVISEERGIVSVVEHGSMVPVPDALALHQWLTSHLEGPSRTWSLHWLGYAGLTHNWQAKLGALASVVVLWLVLIGPQNAEIGFTIPVVYHNIPADLDIEGKRTQEVYLRVRGSREFLALLDPRRLRAQVDLKETQKGTLQYPLSAQDVNVPLGLQVASVDPPTVTVRLKKKPPPEKPTTKEGSISTAPVTRDTKK
jgi:uncharacterized protein (TIGR00159 family)